MKILIICNYKPGFGGISGQVEILTRKLQTEGHLVDIFSTKASTLKRLIIPFLLWYHARRYDTLHIHCSSSWGFMPAVVGICIGQLLGKRIITTYHGGGGDRFFARRHKLVHYWLTHTDCNIVLNGFLAKVFNDHSIPYTIIPNIIELSEKHYRLREVLQPHFICTRAHEPLYNIPCIFHAFYHVQTKLPEASLTLVGYGTQHNTLVHTASKMGLRNVIFTGRVNNSHIYDYLDQADIMISAPSQDNMPVSLLEAMNAGLLVISSKVGGVPYMIEDKATGLLFESNDSDALAELMLWAIKEQTAAKEIIQKAHHEVGKYRWENVKEKIYKSYGIIS